MRKNVLPLSLLFVSSFAMAQVGIGTNNPDKSAMLDIEVSSNNLKGVLIPRVPLKSLTDNSNINNGKTTNSLLVFNTTQNTELNIGYYYWFETTWIRLMTDQDNINRDIPKNDEFAVNVEEQNLYLKDTDENTVSVPLRDINILTTLENKGKGIYVYTSEDNNQTSIDVVADVTNNFESIITNEDVQNALNVYFTNSIPEGNVTYVKEGNSYVFKYLDEKGDNQVIDISEVVKSLETITTITPEIVDGKNTGKYVYKNEELAEVTIDVVADVTNNFESVITNEDVQNALNVYFTNSIPEGNVTYVKEGDNYVFKYLDEKGDNQVIDISEVVKSLETITTITPEIVDGKNTGKYVYKNEELAEVTIDVVADVTNNFESVITNEDVQNALNVYFTNSIPEGNVTYVKEGDSYVFKYLDEKGDNQVIDISEVVKSLETITTITPEIVDGKNTGKYVYKNEELAEVTIDVVADVTNNFESVITNEDVQNALNLYFTNSIPEGNVTYVKEGDSYVFKYLDEKGDNQVIDISEVVKSLETITTITPEIVDGKNTGKYVYKNEELAEVTIDVVADVTNNFESVITNEDVENSIYLKVANKGQKLESTDGVLNIKGGDKAVLSNTKISVNNKSISTEKIKPGVQGQLLITNTFGDVQWVDATDDIIKDVIALNESVTLIKDLQDGTFVYYNEDCFDKDGKFIEGSVGISFDANTLSIKENAPGLITFSDKKGELKVLDIRASNIIIDDTTIGSGNTNVQDVLETIIERITVLDNQSGALSGIGISINQGTSVDKAVLQDINLSIDKNAIDSEHIKADAVLASKIKDGAVTQEKLWAGKGKNQFVAVAQNDGTVKYQAIGSVIQGEALSTDNSLEIEGDASGSLLKGVKVQVAPNGIVTKHIENNAITAGKIGSAGIDAGAVLTTDGSGGTLFVPIVDAVDKAFNGDIIGDAEQTVLVEGGENVLIGDKDKKVTITINKSGIKEKHLAKGAVTAQKLNAEDAKEGSVATVGKKGAVSYQPLTTDLLQEKGNILSGTTISAIQGGVGSVLTDVTLEVNDQSITATKLIATEADKGAVATVGDNGIVSYKPLTSDLFQNKGTIATDNIIAVSDNGIGKVLEDVTLSINDNSIDTKQLANNAVNTNQIADLAVTSDKITSGNIGQGRVLLSDEGGKTQWGELDKIYDAVAGNLSTDNIITIMPNEQGESVSGERALLKDINLGIKDESITNKQIADQTIQIEKLNSKGATDEGMVMVTTKEGGFTYMSKSSIVQKGEDLEVNDGLKFIKGNGKSTVLATTIIGIEDQGITSDKLRDKSVTTAKISSEGADTNAVLTADGKGAVTYKVLNENIFTGQGADLVTDESIEVAANNKALLQETSIAIAKAGVNTQHLKDKAVTTDKISSKQQDQNASEDALLVSDGQGGTMFKTLDNLALQEGKELKTDASITVKGAENALLKEVTIQVATNGIQEEHLNEKSVTIEKINSGGENAGLVLLTDGEGGASFQTVSSAMENTGKTIYEGDAIAVDGGKQAALKDVTISLKNKGVTNEKIADKTIKAIKIDADKASSGTILTSVGDGEAKFLPINSYGQKLDSDTSITVSTTDGVLLAPALIKVSEAGIRTEHIGDKVVTIDKLSSVVDQNNVEAKQILLTDGEGGFDFGTTDDVITKGSILQGETISAKAGAVGSVLSDVTLEVNTLSIDTNHIKDNAVSSAKINKDAVVNEKIAIDAVTTSKIKNKTISFYKISSGKVFDGEEVVTNVPEGQVITADGVGGVVYKSLSSQGKKISTDQSIKVTNGGKAVLNDINISVADKGVTPAKISSEQAKEGAVLVADGKGGAVYKELKASMPKFFYLPSIALDVTPGKSGTRNIYEDYATQFGKPKYANPKAGTNAKLPVLPAEEFNFYITYLEDSIFDEVSISDNGVLTYKVKQDAVITNMSYMNIVLEVRE